MSKIIIENRSKASDIEAISAVMQVMKAGRKSKNGKQYYHYSVTTSGLGVRSSLNKKSDSFVVFDDKNNA